MLNGFFDPVSYQFYFCGVNKVRKDPGIAAHIIRSLREAEPYVVALAKISDPWSLSIDDFLFGCMLTADNAEENYRRYMEQFAAQPQIKTAIRHMPRYIPEELQTPLDRKSAKIMKDKIGSNTNGISKAIDPEELRSFLCCQTDDLSGILYPVRYVKSGFFSLGYRSVPLSAVKTEQGQTNYYKHELCIEIPRALCNYMGKRFELQDEWKKRMKALCDLSDLAIGCIKMDAMLSNNGRGILNHGKLGREAVVSKLLSGYAWLTCVSNQQLEAMGGIEQICAWNVYHDVVKTKNGGALLQLTPDMEMIKRETNAGMVRKLRPFLRLEKEYFDFIPPSFRLELEPDDISVRYNSREEPQFAVRMPY